MTFIINLKNGKSKALSNLEHFQIDYLLDLMFDTITLSYPSNCCLSWDGAFPFIFWELIEESERENLLSPNQRISFPLIVI